MLVGAPSGTEVLWESREASTGQSEDELVELLVREVGRGAMPPVPARCGRARHPGDDRPRQGGRRLGRQPAARRPADPRPGQRARRPAGLRRQRRQRRRPRRAPPRRRAGQPNAVMLTIGTGIGGGLILGGEVYRGATGAGAELGHMVIEIDGPPCQGNCPGRGCVETLASGTALGREGQAAAESDAGLGAGGNCWRRGDPIDGKAVTEAALAGDQTAIAVFELVGRRLGIALTTFANIFEPKAIVVGGGVIAAGDLLLEPARRELRRRALPPMNDDPRPRRRARHRRRDDRRRGDWRGSNSSGARADAGAADRLPDPDRQPRRRHAAGARGAGRRRLSSPARTPAAPARCSTSSASARRRGWSPTTRATKRRGRPSWRSGSSAATSSPSSPTPACRRSPTPATS